ncbi:type II toxin-antitoxin system RelE/ParE family toxin [Pseudochelatococcus sp. B33]
MAAKRWRVRLSAAAEEDVLNIVLWTAEHFGAEQARRYRATIFAALRDLGDGPDATGTRDRAELGRNLRSLHVARRGRRGRHIILFAAVDDVRIEIVRILHDSMDLARHLPADTGDE